jgi:hypothetical protein
METTVNEAPLRHASRRRVNAGTEGGVMSIWWWIGIGTGLFLALSALAALAIAAVLGRISRDISELFEDERWASAPLARDMDEEAERAIQPERRPSRSFAHETIAQASRAGR